MTSRSNIGVVSQLRFNSTVYVSGSHFDQTSSERTGVLCLWWLDATSLRWSSKAPLEVVKKIHATHQCDTQVKEASYKLSAKLFIEKQEQQDPDSSSKLDWLDALEPIVPRIRFCSSLEVTLMQFRSCNKRKHHSTLAQANFCEKGASIINLGLDTFNDTLMIDGRRTLKIGFLKEQEIRDVPRFGERTK